MRRKVVLLFSVICFVSATLVAAPAEARLARPSGLKVAGGTAFDTLKVSWKWSSKPTSYLLKVAEDAKFTDARKVSVDAKRSRPPGGRQTLRLTGLNDATVYFVKIAAVKKGKRSAWSSRKKASTRVRFPSPAEFVRSEPGPGPGEITFRWKTKGDYTDFFKLQTATSPFEQGARDRQVFTIDPALRRYTLTAEQTEQAGAGIGVGWALVWRFHAVRQGTAGSNERYFGQGQSRVPGKPSVGTGSRLRVASYNLRVDDTFDKRAPLVAKAIKDKAPEVVLLQELFPSMIKDFKAGLAARGMDHYRLNRSAAYKTGAPGEKKLQSRLLYDSTKIEMVSDCPDEERDGSCILTFESDGGPDYVAYARMRDIASGQEFWVASFHLTNGSKHEALRTRATRSLVEQLEKLNEDAQLPIILGGDCNSSQLRKGERPHDVLMEAGYYDTASAVEQINEEYGTHNGYEYQKPSPFGISPRIDLITTWGMPGSDRFENVLVEKPDPFPSDHNLIYADLRLPGRVSSADLGGD